MEGVDCRVKKIRFRMMGGCPSAAARIIDWVATNKASALDQREGGPLSERETGGVQGPKQEILLFQGVTKYTAPGGISRVFTELQQEWTND